MSGWWRKVLDGTCSNPQADSSKGQEDYTLKYGNKEGRAKLSLPLNV